MSSSPDTGAREPQDSVSAANFAARVAAIDDAYGYCVEHDRWPDGFNPFNAIRDLLGAVRAYRRSLMAHHNISTLSEDAVRESIGGPCQICARAQEEGRPEGRPS